MVTTSSQLCSKGTTKCVFSKKSPRPCYRGHHFEDEAEALEIANDTEYGLGAGAVDTDGKT